MIWRYCFQSHFQIINTIDTYKEQGVPRTSSVCSKRVVLLERSGKSLSNSLSLIKFENCLGEVCLIQRSYIYYWTLDVSRTASYEITLACLSVRLSVCLCLFLSVRPSVRPSVRTSLNFLKIG